MDFYKIDSQGDTLLILRNPNRPFAVQNSAILWDDALPQYLSKTMRQSKLLARRGTSPIPEANTVPPSIPGDSQQEVRMQLSSECLKRTCKYFRNLAADGWGGSRKSETGYDYTITAEGWDEQALYILMCTLHDSKESLPLQVSVEMFAKIAVIADHYQCREVLPNGLLQQKLPSDYGRHVLLTFFSSWVIRDSRSFGILSRIIVMQSRGRMHSLDLPIPSYVIDAIDAKRQRYVGQIVVLIDEVRLQLLERKAAYAPTECAALHGALMMGIYKAFGVWPLKPPFHAYSIMAFYHALIGIEEPNGTRMIVNHATELATSTTGCSLSSMIIPALDAQMNAMGGVDIRDFSAMLKY